MYCKGCGHRTRQQTGICPQCGASLKAALDVSGGNRRRVRWQAIVLNAIAAIILFGIVPQYLFRSEFEQIGPTDKLRFLRALRHSEYRRSGQLDFHMNGKTLVVTWDLQWETMPSSRQAEIVRIIGRAWNVVGGEKAEFQVEGTDSLAATYQDGEIFLQSALFQPPAPTP
ncbi:MAG TPA: hypothetical protein VFY29_05955 [Terriglobia bacterium]|nr:hypothetical protein [Terriglobia bacterium]